MLALSWLDDLTHLEDHRTFPFEGNLEPRPLEAPVRDDDDSNESDCDECAAPESEFLWTNDRWRLRMKYDTPFPGLSLLYPRIHVREVSDLPAEHLSEMGWIAAGVERALMSLQNTGRVHMVKSGDGHPHLHVWFYPRPRGYEQLRGSLLPLWGLLLRPVSSAVLDEVERHLSSRLIEELQGVSASSDVRQGSD